MLSARIRLNAIFFLIIRADVAKFFQPSVDCVVQAVTEQEKTAVHKISVSIFLILIIDFLSGGLTACYPGGRLCGE